MAAKLSALVLSCLVTGATSPTWALPEPAKEVRLRHLSSSLLAAPVTIGGLERWLMVDTGTRRSLITRRLADELGLVPRGPFGILSPLGTVRRGICAGPVEVRIGGMTLPIDCLGWASSEPEIAFPSGVSGILGVDALGRVEVLFDPARDRLWIGPPGGLTPRVAGDVVPMQRSNGLPAIGAEVRLRGERTRRQVVLIVDSGATAPVFFGAAGRALATGGRPTARYELTSVAGRGMSPSTVVEITVARRRVSLGSAMLPPEYGDREEDGLLPAAALGRFLLDLPGSRLVLDARWVARAGRPGAAARRP